MTDLNNLSTAHPAPCCILCGEALPPLTGDSDRRTLLLDGTHEYAACARHFPPDEASNAEYEAAFDTFIRAAVAAYDASSEASTSEAVAEQNQAASVRTCRICGCTDARACPGGCWWVAPDLCSACQPVSATRSLSALFDVPRDAGPGHGS